MLYGADYNPDQWPEAVWDDDVRLMREAGVNVVSLGIFAWSRIQPAEDVWDFDWLDRVIDKLHAGGIAVNLATATASPPPWVSAVYPETLPADESGASYWPGSRQHFAPSSPTYRRLAGELVRRLAERYVDHPAVVMWHVGNEFGCHLWMDFSDAARDAYRAVAAGAVRDDRRAQRRVGDELLVAAVRGLLGDLPAAARAVQPQSVVDARLAPLHLGHASRVLPHGARDPAQARAPPSRSPRTSWARSSRPTTPSGRRSWT